MNFKRSPSEIFPQLEQKLEDLGVDLNPTTSLNTPLFWVSLCNLCILCVSVVGSTRKFINHGDTENLGNKNLITSLLHFNSAQFRGK